MNIVKSSLLAISLKNFQITYHHAVFFPITKLGEEGLGLSFPFQNGNSAVWILVY